MRRTMLILCGLVSAAGVGALLSGVGAAPAQGVLALNPSHECSYCHATHDAQGGDLLIDTDVEVLCLTCHGPGGSSVLKARDHEDQTCTVCHDPHDGEFNRFGVRNIKMMRAEVYPRGSSDPRPVTFESRGSDLGQPTLHSFCDQDEDNDQIWDNVCDTCHRSEPDRHRYTAPTSHGHAHGRTCTVCHSHDDGFHR